MSSRLRQILFERYDDHYVRANAFPDLSVEKGFRDYLPYYEAVYGPLVDRIPAGATIVDVGCGVGLLLRWLHEREPGRYRMEGLDHSERQLVLARTILPPEIALHRSDATEFLSQRRDAYDVVFCEGFLEHVPGDDDLLDLCVAAAQSLKADGRFVGRVPNMANLLAAYYRYSDVTHGRGFTSLSMRQLLDAADFREITFFEPRAADLGQHIRMTVERLLHRVVFRVCGVNNPGFLAGSLTVVCRAPCRPLRSRDIF